MDKIIINIEPFKYYIIEGMAYTSKEISVFNSIYPYKKYIVFYGKGKLEIKRTGLSHSELTQKIYKNLCNTL